MEAATPRHRLSDGRLLHAALRPLAQHVEAGRLRAVPTTAPRWADHFDAEEVWATDAPNDRTIQRGWLADRPGPALAYAPALPRVLGGHPAVETHTAPLGLAEQCAALAERLGGVQTRDVQTAVIEHAGWDTHVDQGRTFGAQAEELADALAWLLDHAGPVQLITASEFGRSLAENETGGTDHGPASLSFRTGIALPYLLRHPNRRVVEKRRVVVGPGSAGRR